jgi:anoctamin-10
MYDVYNQVDAEVMGIPKQYELGYADLFSLEPTDSSMRPLRLKPYIRDPEYL